MAGAARARGVRGAGVSAHAFCSARQADNTSHGAVSRPCVLRGASPSTPGRRSPARAPWRRKRSARANASSLTPHLLRSPPPSPSPAPPLPQTNQHARSSSPRGSPSRRSTATRSRAAPAHSAAATLTEEGIDGDRPPRHVGRRHVPDAARPAQARDGAGRLLRRHAHAPRGVEPLNSAARGRHNDGDALRRQGVAARRRRRRRQVVFAGARLRRLAPLLGLQTFKLLGDRPLGRRSCSSATPASSRSTRGASPRRCRRCQWTASGPTSSSVSGCAPFEEDTWCAINRSARRRRNYHRASWACRCAEFCTVPNVDQAWTGAPWRLYIYPPAALADAAACATGGAGFRVARRRGRPVAASVLAADGRFGHAEGGRSDLSTASSISGAAVGVNADPRGEDMLDRRSEFPRRDRADRRAAGTSLLQRRAWPTSEQAAAWRTRV